MNKKTSKTLRQRIEEKKKELGIPAVRHYTLTKEEFLLKKALYRAWIRECVMRTSK